MSFDFNRLRLTTAEALAQHLDALVALDPRFQPVRAVAGDVHPRTTPGGFEGMARAITGQQLSVASARAIWSRFESLPGALRAETFLLLSEDQVRAVGFSAGKFRTVRGLAEAVASGALDFARIESLPADDAILQMTRFKGVGPWTAELYLLFCAGHPDVLPAGDLALQKAAGMMLGRPERPDTKQLREIASAWAPHRGAAALLLWRYFAASRQKDGVAL